MEDCNLLYKQGEIVEFGSIAGDTCGSLFESNTRSPWIKRYVAKLYFGNNLLFRWQGKRFISPFDEKHTGKGINSYKNRIMPLRFPFKTSIEKALFDGKFCLVLDYHPFPSPTFGTRDDLRMIEDGVFLGQGYHRFPWEKQYSFIGYFVLCALNLQA
jgi:hypothetical protein